MAWFSKLFGSGDAGGKPPVGVEYNGFRIIAAPVRDGSTWRIGARIEAEIDGEIKAHDLIRADTLQSLEDAESASVAKAKQVIDEQGKRLFT